MQPVEGARWPERLDHPTRVHTLVECPRSGALVGGARDGMVIVWSGPDRAKVTWQAHDQAVLAVACSQVADLIASGSESGVVRMWLMPQRTLLWEFRHDSGAIGTLCFTSQGTLISTGHDTTIRELDPLQGTELRRMAHEAEVYSAAFGPDGSLSTGGDDQCLRTWDIGTGAATGTRRDRGNAFSSIAITRDGRVVAVGPRLLVFPSAVGVAPPVQLRDRSHHGWLTCVALAPDGLRFATGGEDGVVRIWRFTDGVEERALRGHAGGVSRVVFMVGAGLLAAADDRGVVLHPW